MDAAMYERALDRTRVVVEGVRTEQLSDPTPCTDWDVRALLNHIVWGLEAFAAGGAGERLESSGGDHLGDDPVGSFERASKAALEVFRDPEALKRQFPMPWGDTPGTVVLGLAIADAVVHGWDLAQATGQRIVIDDDVAQAVYGMTSTMMEPLGSFPRGQSFQEPVEIADDALISDKMLAYLGRKP